jgi:hypothetical protein
MTRRPPPEAAKSRRKFFPGLIARNPLKRPDSDEENKIKQNKTKEIQARFAWFSFVLLGNPAAARAW